MSRPKDIEKYEPYMFADLDQIEHELTAAEIKQLLRYRSIFTFKLEQPFRDNVYLVDMLMNEHDISKSQAYRDIGTVEIFLPKVSNAGKEWIRYIVVEGLKNAIQRAKDAGRIKEEILGYDKLAKYSRLDQLDPEPLPFDQIVPAPVEPVTDPSVIGIKPIPDLKEKIRKLTEKYSAEIEIEDIDYEELSNETESLLQ